MAVHRLGSARALEPRDTPTGPEAWSDPDYPHALVSRLVDEMDADWRRGQHTTVDDFLTRFPRLAEHPGALVWLIYEEVSLRREAGEVLGDEAALGRFPQCRAALAAVLCSPTDVGPASTAPAAPRIGEHLGQFRLRAELARGQTGRVYLASQGSLADRPVVLKVTPREGGEHLSLARLQHPAIVPIFSVEDFPDRDLRVLCMPYLGGVTLDALFRELRTLPAGDRTGSDIVGVLDRASAPLPPSVSAGAPARQFLARASYPEALCWLGACLADAVQYAHERGLLHLDLKPSNVLLTADGWPMLLDFHLARGPVAPGSPAAEGLGGTPGYMSPEQKGLVAAWRQGRPAPSGVDGRSDIYSLGVLLHEAAHGELPAEPPGQAPAPARRPAPPGFEATVARCLEPRPEDRYADAGALAADLRACVGRKPPRGGPRHILIDRWRHWVHRTIHAVTRAAAITVLLGAGAAVGLQALHQSREARAALARGRTLIDASAVDEAEVTLRYGRDLVRYLPGGARALRGDLDDQVRRAGRAKAARSLHQLAEEVRFLFGEEGLSPEAARSLERQCRSVWETRGRLTRPVGGALAPATERAILVDLTDLAVFRAQLCTRLAPGPTDPEARGRALRILSEAEDLLGAGPTVAWEREQIDRPARAAGVLPVSAPKAPRPAPRDAWEHTALGRSYLSARDWRAASAEFERALDLEPQAFWPNFYRGLAAYRMGGYDDAVGAFTAAVALAPEGAECFYNRALAYSALGDDGRALRDYDQALRLNPSLGPASLNRGILRYRAGRFDESEADLRLALARGEDPGTVHYHLALVRRALHDRAGALASIRVARRHLPASNRAREMEDRIRRDN